MYRWTGLGETRTTFNLGRLALQSATKKSLLMSLSLTFVGSSPSPLTRTSTWAYNSHRTMPFGILECKKMEVVPGTGEYQASQNGGDIVTIGQT